MQLSSKGRYALRVMTDIARNNQEFVSINDISNRQHISVKYMEKIIAMLVKSKLLVSMRGVNGGYKLTKKPEEYSVLEILEAVGEVTKISACSNGAECDMLEKCDTARVWTGLSKLINDYLAKTTLKDLINK